MTDTSTEKKSVGGISFLLGFFSLPLVLIILIIFSALYIQAQSLTKLFTFIPCFALGLFLSKLLLTRSKGVYFHELRHALISSLVGNKAVKMKVERKIGSFEYKYSKESEKYNAFIALAPYTLPLFTFLCVIISWFVPQYFIIILALGLGFDCEQWWRDLGPHQTDINTISGGVFVGMLFVVMFELIIIFLVTLLILNGSLFLTNWADFIVLITRYILS